jgi:hypothetical protein
MAVEVIPRLGLEEEDSSAPGGAEWCVAIRSWFSHDLANEG